MRIAYLGPEGRNQILQEWASPGVTVETRSGNFNGSIESTYDEYMYIPNMLQTVAEIEREGFDAAVVGCFGDPGIDGARELVKMPVIGIAEASLHVASMLSDRYGIITATTELLPMLRRLAAKYHLDHGLVEITDIGCAVMEIRRNPEAQYPTLVATAKRMIAEKGAESLILGCGSMSFYADRLSADVGVPCINPLKVGLKVGEMLAGTGLTHSKRSYPSPTSLRS